MQQKGHTIATTMQGYLERFGYRIPSHLDDGTMFQEWVDEVMHVVEEATELAKQMQNQHASVMHADSGDETETEG